MGPEGAGRVAAGRTLTDGNQLRTKTRAFAYLQSRHVFPDEMYYRVDLAAVDEWAKLFLGATAICICRPPRALLSSRGMDVGAMRRSPRYYAEYSLRVISVGICSIYPCSRELVQILATLNIISNYSEMFRF